MLILKRYIRPVIGLSITALFLQLILRHISWAQLAAVLEKASLLPLVLALLLLAADFFIRIFRWWWMLRILEPELPLRNCVWPFLASVAINNILPLRAGDVSRVMGFRNYLRSHQVSVLGTLIIERLLDLLVLLAFFFIGLLPLESTLLPQRFLDTATILAFISIVALAVLLTVPHLVHVSIRWLLQRTLTKCTIPTTEKLFEWLTLFFETLYLVRSKKLTSELLLLSIVAWMLEGGVFACVAWALLAPLSLHGTLFSLATGTLATLIPSSPGYIGTFDFFTMYGVMAYGMARDIATGFALTVHVVLWLPLTFTGCVYFLTPTGRKTWSKTSL